MKIEDLRTPVLLLDTSRLESNLGRMRARVTEGGVALRPHVKTSKSGEIVRRAMRDRPWGITVSTLAEADYFFKHGITDILYAVGIAPGKLARVAELIRQGAAVTIVLDNLAAAGEVARAAERERVRFQVLIELDVDGHRSGVTPESPLLLEIGRYLAKRTTVGLRGVMTHAGESYNCDSVAAIRTMAERERAGAVLAADRLRSIGIDVPVVSVGSTPTATFADNFAGVTEVRAGVYMLQDLVMAGLGVCTLDDIAASVLVTVIGHQEERGWIITDGGWTALSRDRGTARQKIDQGYGVVCDARGHVLSDDMIVASVNQEHGVIARRGGGAIDVSRYPIGTLLRILPNHACATAAQYSHYDVVDADGIVTAQWPRIRGW